MSALATESRTVQRSVRHLWSFFPRISAVQPALEQKPAPFTPESQPERRREVRYPTCDAVEVSALDVPGFQVQAILRDVSRNGLCIELGLPVEAGARLRITLRDQTVVLAAACYCRKTATSYQVGAAIQGVYQAPQARAGLPRRVHSNIWRVDKDAISGSEEMTQSGELAHAIVNDTLFFTCH